MKSCRELGGSKTSGCKVLGFKMVQPFWCNTFEVICTTKAAGWVLSYFLPRGDTILAMLRWERGTIVKKNFDRAFLRLFTDCKLQNLVSRIKETLECSESPWIRMFMCLLEVLTASFFVGHGQMLPVPFTMLGLKLNGQLTSIMNKNCFISAVRLTTKFQPCKNRCTFSWEIDGNSKCYAIKWASILVGPKVPEDIWGISALPTSLSSLSKKLGPSGQCLVTQRFSARWRNWFGPTLQWLVWQGILVSGLWGKNCKTDVHNRVWSGREERIPVV